MDSLSIQDWGAIGEIVGGFGVIATLLYLASQIRQNTKHLASASLQAMSQRAEDRMMAAAQNAQFASVIRRWNEEKDLTQDELLQASNWMTSWLNDLQDGYRQMRLGIVDEIVLKGRTMAIASMIQSRHGREQWENLREFAEPSFVEWFEKELKKMVST